MAESVDRLELVADREQVALLQGAENRELARVGVLELVDHQELEALRPCAPDRLAGLEQCARAQLEVVEIEAAALLLELLVGVSKAPEQLVEQRAGPDRVRLGAGVCALARVQRGRRIGQAGPQLAAAAQLGVHRHHDPRGALHPVGGQQVERLGPALGHEALEGVREGLLAKAPRQPFVEDREGGVDSGVERVRTQQPRAESVEGPDEGCLGVPRGLPLSQFQQPRTNAGAELAGGALGECDREDPAGRHPVLAYRRHEALHQHGGLAAAGRSGQRQLLTTAADRLALLGRQLWRLVPPLLSVLSPLSLSPLLSLFSSPLSLSPLLLSLLLSPFLSPPLLSLFLSPLLSPLFLSPLLLSPLLSLFSSPFLLPRHRPHRQIAG